MRLPLNFDPVSNGEYMPPPKSGRDTRAEALARKIVERNARRTGKSRREFLVSSCGMAACLSAVNAASASTDGAYKLARESTLDPAAAEATLAGDEFIFDIQSHHVMPRGDWEKHSPGWKLFVKGLGRSTDPGRYAYIKEMFLDSDTTCAVLSAVPATPEAQPLPDKDAATTREIVDTLGKSPRLAVHAFVAPNIDPLKAQLEGMERVAKEFKIAAWKLYTLWGPKGDGYWLDDDKFGIPVIEKARELGIKTICLHKGIPLWGTKGGYETCRDIGPVAKKYTDVKFIVYHSGWQSSIKEGPYDPAAAERGVNGLLKTLDEHDIKPNANVYAELGTTWAVLMKRPEQAAHALGKLLKRVGENNVLWGTDSIWYGSPQPQIAGFRAFQIAPELREKHGYPEMTKEIKAKVFGLNSAVVYGFDPKAARQAIEKDAVEKLKEAYVPKSDPTFLVYGPRTRREFFDLLAKRGGLPA